VHCCATAGLNSSRTSTWDQKSCCFASGRYYMYTSYVPLSDKYTWTHCQAQHLASNIYKYERKLTKKLTLGSFHADIHTIKESGEEEKKRATFAELTLFSPWKLSPSFIGFYSFSCVALFIRLVCCIGKSSLALGPQQRNLCSANIELLMLKLKARVGLNEKKKK
jgi:hypothetical protein